MRGGNGLVAQLRRPPGGRDARIMLSAQFVDRIGSGVWAASSVLYFTFVAGLSAQRLGVLLGVAGVAGIAGSPTAGRLAGRFPVRRLLIGVHLLRLVTLTLLVVCGGFWALLPVVALTSLGDRAAKTLEMVFATRIAGDQRSTYQALWRSVANAGTAVGAGIAAIGLAVGTRDAYSVLILGDALSFLLAAAMVARAREPRARAVASGPAGPSAPGGASEPIQANPWRDRRYLLFVALDTPLSLDDAVLNVGLPLWLVHRTSAPHALIPAFLVINTVLVVLLQLRVSALVRNARQATSAVLAYGASFLTCCVILASCAGAGTWPAAAAMLVAALVVTGAELMRSVTSWELAVSLAPKDAQASYLGVAGMAQSIQKSAGPLLLTGAVMVAGPVGWAVLGTAVAGLTVLQRRNSLRRLDEMASGAVVEGRAGPALAAR